MKNSNKKKSNKLMYIFVVLVKKEIAENEDQATTSHTVKMTRDTQLDLKPKQF